MCVYVYVCETENLVISDRENHRCGSVQLGGMAAKTKFIETIGKRGQSEFDFDFYDPHTRERAVMFV